MKVEHGPLDYMAPLHHFLSTQKGSTEKWKATWTWSAKSMKLSPTESPRNPTHVHSALMSTHVEEACHGLWVGSVTKFLSVPLALLSAE